MATSSTRKSSDEVPGWPPLILTPVPEEDIANGDGPEVCRTIETYCRVSKDGFAARGGDLVRLRPWQKRLLGCMFARRPDGRLRHRTCLVGMPRKNGKSAVGSGLALDGLLFGGLGSDVFSCAGDKAQAAIVFDETKKMIHAEPELLELCRPMKDTIEVPETNSVYRVLSSEAFTKEGLNPQRVLFDEVHVQPNRELWNVMELAMAARLDPMMIGITTAGVMTDSTGEDSLCYSMWKYGKSIAEGEIDDPSFFMAWWGAPDVDPDSPPGKPRPINHTDPRWWAFANPGYGDIVDPEDFASVVRKTPENEFRTKRLNQWVGAQSAWLPNGAWEALQVDREAVEDGTEVVLAFDGSHRQDSTALIVATLGSKPFVDVVQVWERPKDAPEGWKIDVLEVEEAIKAACRRWTVVEIVCDPYRWQRTMSVLEDDGLPVVEFPQNAARLVPATTRFYEAVMNGLLEHNGSPVLARHLRNAVTKTDERGTRIVKETKGSARKIDAAVAAVMAVDRAAQAEAQTEPRVWTPEDLAALIEDDEETEETSA